MMTVDRRWLRLNFAKVCRFCLSLENCVPLFIESTLNECLLDAVDVLVPKVDENDGLPNRVCSECHRKMVDFVQFEATALEAYGVLESVLTTHHDDGDEHCDDDEPDAEDVCDDPGALTSDEQLEKSMEAIPDLENISTDNHHTVHASTESNTKSIKSLKKKACPVCGKLVSQISKHVQVHSEAKNFSCEHCDKRFAHRSSLQKHLNIHRNIRKYRCEYCEQCFCDRSSLRYHLAKHRGVQRFHCEPCDRPFYTSTQYKQHQSLAHRERSFRCELCGRMFLLKHHLMEHRQLHTDERSFECDVCGKRFKRERYLYVHKRQHSSHEQRDSTEQPLHSDGLE
ncbi:gastrula zinc finger protein XlCGF52.1-like isoform X1 [Anopheles stephensi]|uniref:gastrula zinc finger protein XlCGF52.1-like isoform X1 n=2 Tax=Anopheles stephensi TaxID=30069 RepID=UPI0007D5469C|nr:gastrula zinc finger protein XlCGF52.1-like isoform X1 [Anopheles stephensi]